MSNQSRWLLSAYAALFRGAVLDEVGLAEAERLEGELDRIDRNVERARHEGAERECAKRHRGRG